MTDHVCHYHIPLVHERPLAGIEEALVDALLRDMVHPNSLIEQVAVGPRFISVVAGGRAGMASLLGAQPADHEQGLIYDVIGKTAGHVAGYLKSTSPFAVSLGTAALNAAYAPDLQNPSDVDEPAEELLVELGRGKVVGVVGEFPFVRLLKEQVGGLHLFELRDVEGSVSRERWDDVLANLDVLAVTGTALLTRYLGYFLTSARRATSVIIGPTTPLSQALFAFGADYLCGAVVIDPEQVLEGVRAGLSFREIKKKGGVRLVTLKAGRRRP